MIYTKENKYDLFIQMMDTLSSLGLNADESIQDMTW
jgi:hypothetical protein